MSWTVAPAFADQGNPPKFEEVYQLLQHHLEGVSPAELDHAALKGLLAELSGQVILAGPGGANLSTGPAAVALGKCTVYDDRYACFQIVAVTADLPAQFRASYQNIVKTNKSRLKGIILDLRFASGGDYAAAVAVANCFLNSDQPLLEWGAGSARATKKADAIDLPVAILVNAQTSGAAEALAAALREANIGLILGGSTAGQANIFKEFTLTNGARLRIATAQVKLGDGTVLAHALKPDISVPESLADERAYLEDPYKSLPAPDALRNASNTNLSASIPGGPAPRRMNEAELVRQRKAGENPDESDDTIESPVALPPAAPVMADPVLARALDLLKGLAVLQQGRPG